MFNYSLQNAGEIVNETEKIKLIHQELEASFNSSFDEIWVTDGEGNTLAVNKAAEQLYGIKTGEIIGKNVRELEKGGLFFPSIALQAIAKKQCIISVQLTRRGRKLIVIANPIFDENNNIIRVINYNRDITELSSLKKRLAETERLLQIYRNEIVQMRQEQETDKMIASSPIMKNILHIAKKVAMVDSNVLIQGESGVGKGVIARHIHKLSRRHKGPFITIDCGAIPENLIESELFGYEGGAFTGAKKEGKKGLIELANGGSAFFDEIGELPLSLQVKLLRIIQEKRLIRVGGTQLIDVDIRVLAASNRNLQELVNQRKFREDLFYRLNVVPLEIPPLRSRKDEIRVFIGHFTSVMNEKYGFSKRFSLEAINILENYSWPGNIRELENLVERVMVITDSNEIFPKHLPEHLLPVDSKVKEKVAVWDICSLQEAKDEVEKQLLKKVQAKYKNTYKMAEILKVNQSTVVRKLHKYGLAEGIGNERKN